MDELEISDDPEDVPWECELCHFTTPDWMTLQRHWMQHEVHVPALLAWVRS